MTDVRARWIDWEKCFVYEVNIPAALPLAIQEMGSDRAYWEKRGKVAPVGLRINFSLSGDCVLPIQSLVDLISTNPTGMISLSLQNVELEGRFDDFLSILLDCTNLKRFYFEPHSYRYILYLTKQNFVNFGQTLGKLPHLESFFLDSTVVHVDESPVVSLWDLFGPKIQNPNHKLKEIVFKTREEGPGFTIDDQFYEAIANSQTLKNLDIDAPLTGSHNPGLCQIIRQTRNLKHLVFKFRETFSLLPVVEALKINTSLDSIECGGFHPHNPRSDELAKFHDLVKNHNFNLRRVEIVGEPNKDTMLHFAAIYFHVRINKRYRTEFLNGKYHPTVKEWTRLVRKEEIPIIYYLLRENVGVIIPKS